MNVCLQKPPKGQGGHGHGERKGPEEDAFTQKPPKGQGEHGERKDAEEMSEAEAEEASDGKGITVTCTGFT